MCSLHADERNLELAGLLAQVALGDRAAFGTLYHQTSPQLMGVVLRIHRDRAQAEDVLQEVYVNVWGASQSFDARLSQPLTWLASIARHRAIDALRRRRSEPLTLSGMRWVGDCDDEPDLLHNLPGTAAGPQELVEQAAEVHALRRCFGGLSGQQKQCMALAYYQGLSHAEVATHLGQPLGSVKSWVRRGLLHLRTCLGCRTQGQAAR